MVSAELTRRGVNPSDLGTHLMRKGAATFCASGSTACPSSTAVHLRAGSSLGGVQNTYLRYETAGDIHVRRSVAGLPSSSHPESKLKATGLPPHVSILSQMKELQSRTLSTFKKIEEARHEIVKDIVHELENRAIGASPVTYDGLHDALRNCLAEVGVHELISKHSTSDSQAAQESDTPDEHATLPTFVWDGRFRRVPPDFALPECSVAHLWVLWRCGNAEKQYPPLYLLEGADMPNRNTQKRLSDARYLMKKIEALATAKNLLRRRQTVEEAVQVFTACSSAVEVPPQHRTRPKETQRAAQLDLDRSSAQNRRQETADSLASN
ncbi:unnamed protein product [Phytophthora lilii]|uniref:Unnamed protein product n=1 Tax=Phytophthora lilii TaxID=2077276 RepID=A0A9W6X6I2_9STRA|nr:unnamed protein product [Phytophthora lilii]